MYSKQEKILLLNIAKQSIKYGLEHKSNSATDISQYPAHLQQHAACFVTLKLNGKLRGCIGSLEAYRPLIEDIVNNAYAAAFNDPRFTAISNEEFTQLHYHISVLSPPEEFLVTSEKDLLSKLCVGKDGLILEDKSHRATFLPSVWNSLPAPQQFVNELKQKAGLPANYWSDTIHFKRYVTESIELE